LKTELGKKTPLEENRIPHRRPRRTSKTPLSVASGVDFDVDEYLRDTPFKPQQIYRKEEIPPKDNPERQPLTESGFVLLVAQKEYPELIEEVLRALDYWEEEFHLLSDAGADKMVLDFGITEQAMLQRPQYLPPELILAMSRLEMGLVFSVVRGQKRKAHR
jgi:hypothetical protein